MKKIWISIIFFLTACANTTSVPVVISETPYPTLTPLPSSTITLTPINTVISPTNTFTATAELLETFTPSPTIENTKPPTGEAPGVQVSGYVTQPDGAGVDGATIYYAFASYPGGNFLSTTNAQGYYSEFIPIPHTETIRVWAEYPDLTFKPGDAEKPWYNGEFGWVFYGGYEYVRLSFIVSTP